MTERNDRLVADYLSRVSQATAGLPPAQRDELIRDLREHIEARRAELPAETEAQVRELLDRLGDPDVIARAAAEDAGTGLPVAGPPANAPAGSASGRRTLTIIVAVGVSALLLLLCLFLMFFSQSSEGGSPM